MSRKFKFGAISHAYTHSANISEHPLYAGRPGFVYMCIKNTTRGWENGSVGNIFAIEFSIPEFDSLNFHKTLRHGDTHACTPVAGEG